MGFHHLTNVLLRRGNLGVPEWYSQLSVQLLVYVPVVIPGPSLGSMLRVQSLLETLSPSPFAPPHCPPTHVHTLSLE